jgi:hypothetical protein
MERLRERKGIFIGITMRFIQDLGLADAALKQLKFLIE